MAKFLNYSSIVSVRLCRDQSANYCDPQMFAFQIARQYESQKSNAQDSVQFVFDRVKAWRAAYFVMSVCTLSSFCDRDFFLDSKRGVTGGIVWDSDDDVSKVDMTCAIVLSARISESFLQSRCRQRRPSRILLLIADTACWYSRTDPVKTKAESSIPFSSHNGLAYLHLCELTVTATQCPGSVC
eukprot:IDg1885t1